MGLKRHWNIRHYSIFSKFVWKFFPKLAVRQFDLPVRVVVPKRAIEIWQERADLKIAFDLTTAAGRHNLIWWFLFSGFNELGIVADCNELACLAPLRKPFPGLPRLGSMPIDWLMRELGRREGYALSRLKTRDQQDEFLAFFFLEGLAKYSLQSLLTEEQAKQLLASDAMHSRVPQILAWLWRSDPQLHQRFAGSDDPAFLEWVSAEGAAYCPILAHGLIGLAQDERRKPDKNLPFGVNLVGHARARLGTGEDVRMAAKALTAAKIPFVIHDFAAGHNIGAEDDSVSCHMSQDMPYAITMFCVTGMETVRAIAAIGRKIVDQRMTIGFWAWELPEWPRFWNHAFADMDEVWASSRYTYDAYVNSAPGPVRHLPMVVDIDDRAYLCRADFQLPAGAFLFAFSYDGLSSSARKNPEACLAAFDRAFPDGNESVGLVIKGLRVDGSPVWEALKARAAKDPRIHLVDQSLSRDRLLDLYRSVDCFISLHRAEGFGRNIAEFMALGKPVIVTAHSGNMDFTTSDTAALVPARARTLAPGDYPFGSGQTWADPDVEVAAAYMQRMVEDAVWRENLAQRGAEKIRTDYAPEPVGKAWAAALRQGFEAKFGAEDSVSSISGTFKPVQRARSGKELAVD